MFATLHNANILSKLVAVNNPVTCLSIRSLRITYVLGKAAETRTPEAIFIKANPEVPILAVTDKDNVDIIGPPDPVSNLRPIVRKRILHETPLQRQLRELQDEAQAWNQKFWSEHNKKFIEEKQNFIKSHKVSIDENRILTADEMSDFYKKFLDENWKIHFSPEGQYGKFNEKFIAGPKLTEIYQPSFKRLPQILHTYLPASATNIKLFDDIGNNSKSTVIHQDTYITLRFEARYPLRQSWKTKYILQYDVPVHEYLKRNENLFLLKMRVVDHVLPNAIIRDVQTKVILPEDSEIKSVISSEEVKRDQDERMYTALTFNRPTVTFIAKHLPEECVPEFIITYSTPSYGLFKPALLISAYIEVMLFSCIVFRRIDMYLRNS